MNTFLYDVLRVLTNRGVLLIVALTAALAFTGVAIYTTIAHNQNPLLTPQQQAQQEEQAIAAAVLIMGIIFTFFVPLLGIQAGYSTYARDRATGVLESILVLPVSRARIMLSRFTAVVIASAAGIGLALVVLDALSVIELHTLLPGGQVAALFLALLVETIAFGGVLFLIAHLVRTPGAVMGAAVVTFVLIDVVWFFLLIFVGLLLGGISTVSGLQSVVRLEYADPAGYPFLMLAYAQGGLFGGFVSEPLGVLGIGPGGLILAGVLWSVGPFLLALYLGTRYD